MLNRENMFVPIVNSYRNVIGCSLRRGKVRGRKKGQDHITNTQTERKVCNECIKKYRDTYYYQGKASQIVCIHNQSSSFSVTHDKASWRKTTFPVGEQCFDTVNADRTMK